MNCLNRNREKRMSLLIPFFINYNQRTRNSRTWMVCTTTVLKKFEKVSEKTAEDSHVQTFLKRVNFGNISWQLILHDLVRGNETSSFLLTFYAILIFRNYTSIFLKWWNSYISNWSNFIKLLQVYFCRV